MAKSWSGWKKQAMNNTANNVWRQPRPNGRVRVLVFAALMIPVMYLAAVWQVARADQPPFTDPSYFARRLAVYGLTEAQLRDLLGEPAEALRRRLAGRLPWFERLRTALESADGLSAMSNDQRCTIPAQPRFGAPNASWISRA